MLLRVRWDSSVLFTYRRDLLKGVEQSVMNGTRGNSLNAAG